MARAAKLNVYVTAAGFFDAVVAAPNQKAALAAWGVHANLFADGVAGPEQDPEWRDRALASPGEVIRKPRGDPAALLAQSAPKHPAAKPSPAPSPASPRKTEPTRRVAPPPPPPPADRTPLTAAERALADARQVTERSRAELADRRRALEDEAAELQDRWEAQEAELGRAVEQARRAFVAAGGAL